MKNNLCILSIIAIFAGVSSADTVYPPKGWVEKKDPAASEFATKGGLIRIYAGPAPKSLNYYVDCSVYTARLFDLLYSPLLGLDPETLKFVPGLADSWTVSDDGCVFTFHLDPRAKWSDGKPVLAKDVIWTYDAIMNPANQTGPFKVAMEKFFRPEAIELGKKDNAYVLDAKVELTEMLGDNTNVYVNIADANAILKVNPHDTPATDSNITFSIPVESVYLFDAQTEMVIK